MSTNAEINNQLVKKYFTYTRYFIASYMDTLPDINLQIFRFVRFYWEQGLPYESQREQFKQMSDQDAYNLVMNDPKYPKPYVIRIKTNAVNTHDQKVPCFFCNQTTCQNCELNSAENMGQEIILGDLVEKIKNPNFYLAFDVYWNNKPDFINLLSINSSQKLKDDDSQLISGKNSIRIE